MKIQMVWLFTTPTPVTSDTGEMCAPANNKVVDSNISAILLTIHGRILKHNFIF